MSSGRSVGLSVVLLCVSLLFTSSGLRLPTLQRIHVTVWSWQTSHTHLIIEIHPSSVLVLFASFFFVFSGSSRVTFILLTSAISKKSVLTLEATCSHLSAWGHFYFLYMWKDLWIMSITVLYMKATLKLLWAASSNLSSKHHIRIIIINIITNIILLLLIRVKDTLTDVLYCEKWWAVKTWIWDECQ